MTRWIFAILILANLGILMWASWYRGDSSGVVSPRPLLHPETMVPIASPGVELKTRRSDRAATPLVATKPKLRCVSIGPIAGTTVDATAGWLRERKFEFSPRNEQKSIESSYWIHLGPFDSRELAEKKMKSLATEGVRDLLIMTDGQGRPSISLGLFAQVANARSRLTELEAKGVKAQQEIRFRQESVTWFEVKLPEPADTAVAEIKNRSWEPSTEIKEYSCPPGKGAGSSPAPVGEPP